MRFLLAYRFVGTTRMGPDQPSHYPTRPDRTLTDSSGVPQRPLPYLVTYAVYFSG